MAGRRSFGRVPPTQAVMRFECGSWRIVSHRAPSASIKNAFAPVVRALKHELSTLWPILRQRRADRRGASAIQTVATVEVTAFSRHREQGSAVLAVVALPSHPTGLPVIRPWDAEKTPRRSGRSSRLRHAGTTEAVSLARRGTCGLVRKTGGHSVAAHVEDHAVSPHPPRHPAGEICDPPCPARVDSRLNLSMDGIHPELPLHLPEHDVIVDLHGRSPSVA